MTARDLALALPDAPLATATVIPYNLSARWYAIAKQGAGQMTEDGSMTPPHPAYTALLAWQTTPPKLRTPKRLHGLATALDVPTALLLYWQDTVAFQVAWDAAVKARFGASYEAVCQALVDKALAGDLGAITLYLNHFKAASLGQVADEDRRVTLIIGTALLPTAPGVSQVLPMLPMEGMSVPPTADLPASPLDLPVPARVASLIPGMFLQVRA